MSQRLNCPGCRATLHLHEAHAPTAALRCPGCGKVFPAPGAAPPPAASAWAWWGALVALDLAVVLCIVGVGWAAMPAPAPPAALTQEGEEGEGVPDGPLDPPPPP